MGAAGHATSVGGAPPCSIGSNVRPALSVVAQLEPVLPLGDTGRRCRRDRVRLGLGGERLRPERAGVSEGIGGGTARGVELGTDAGAGGQGGEILDG